MRLFKPQNPPLDALRMMAKEGYIRAQIVAQTILERTNKDDAAPQIVVQVLFLAIAGEGYRFQKELQSVSASSHDLLLRCFLKLIWEFHKETYGRTKLWTPRGWVPIETLVLNLKYFAQVPREEPKDTYIARDLAGRVLSVLHLQQDQNAINWIFNCLLASVTVTAANMIYLENLKRIDWNQAKVSKYALQL